MLRVISGEALARAADRESLIVEQPADLANDDDVLTLVVAPVAPSFHRLELWKLLLPVSENVGFYLTKLAYFANREVTFARYRGQFITLTGFQHMLPLVLSVSVLVEKSPRGGLRWEFLHRF